ncbi:MAG: gas vesicle protein GvpG [Labilithrix sp.]|nr:gas vesicle protein GvpG [Labilithrix sp.]
MLIVDALIVSGVRFVLTRIAEAVEAEMVDDAALREELLAAQMKLELGEIDEAEFAAIEAGVLRGLREIAERKRGGREEDERSAAPRGRITVERVEADLDHRDG